MLFVAVVGDYFFSEEEAGAAFTALVVLVLAGAAFWIGAATAVVLVEAALPAQQAAPGLAQVAAAGDTFTNLATAAS